MISPQDILDRVDRIRPLPGTVLRMIRVINDPASTVEDIVETVRYDQAVTSQMLKIVNSAFFGLTRDVTSLHEALRCLGTVKVLQLVMAVHTNSLLSTEQRGYGMPPGVLWQHSVGVAIAASALAERLGVATSNLLFTAGLLHDIGKVILNEYVAGEFAEIARRVRQEKVSFLEAERQVLGFSHDQIGGQVAEKWKLPDPIIIGIRYHHRPAELATPHPVVDLLHLADCLCMLLGIGLGSDGLCYPADAEVMERCHLKEQDLEMMGALVLTEVQRVRELFGESAGTEPACCGTREET